MSGLLKSSAGHSIEAAYQLSRRYIPINKRLKKQDPIPSNEYSKIKDEINKASPIVNNVPLILQDPYHS
jgi:hypothetical protein